MKRRTKIAIGTTCIAILIAVVSFAIYAQQETMRRFYAFAGYANAVSMYDLRSEPLPVDLNEIETEYNKWDQARVKLPEAPYHLHPIYRPPTGLAGGPFLLFIEPRPPGTILPITMLIWANADGSNTRVETVSNWNLSEIIHQDDRNRQRETKP